jgi:hypothetical protein
MKTKGTIEILRNKGLTDQEIEDIMNARSARLIQDAYTTGMKEGVRATLANLIQAAKYARLTDEELMA